MSRQSPEANAALRRERQKQIIDAALTVYIECGFHGADIDLIAQRAGLAKGLVYYYYPTKLGLFRALFESCLERIIAIERDILDSLSGLPPVESLVRYLQGFIGTSRDEPLLLRFAVRLPFDAFAVFGEAGWKKGLRKANIHQRSLATLVKNALRDQGLESPDPERAAAALWAVIIAGLLDYVSMTGARKAGATRTRKGDRDVINQYLGFCLRGLSIRDKAWQSLLDTHLTPEAR